MFIVFVQCLNDLVVFVALESYDVFIIIYETLKPLRSFRYYTLNILLLSFFSMHAESLTLIHVNRQWP